ncbi:hypothetical protein SUDANB105_05245 [Streptomyces sp. enrichment culture]|uniref:AbiJ-related protein n=1 Tax=Streptomyces sp. enrichment culture TaxID=1795815 RepID=UPI003F566238
MTKHRFLVARQVGAEPFSYARTCLDVDRVERLRGASLDDVTDLDAAYELTRLTMTDLEAFGMGGGETLNDEEIAVVLRTLRAVLQRLGVSLTLPFRDFKSFKAYWRDRGMSGSYAARQNYISSVFGPVLARLDEYHPHLRQSRARRITDVTRRRLRDGLKGGWWGGTLDEVQFLSRLYDLDNLPSYDSRFITAAQDVWQHCINNPSDWEDDWIWHDERFGLADSDDALLRFLAEMLHPEVRTDAEEAERLCAFFNKTLAHDGYELIEVDRISGAPVLAARTIGAAVPGAMKNLIFAADGPKPEFVLGDAINNDVLIVKNEQYCLVYSQPLSASGLTWGEMIAWWRARESLPEDMPDEDVGRALYKRLSASLHHDAARPEWVSPEQMVFRTYCELYPINEKGASQPALLPQVYLHMDPKTRNERAGKDSVLGRERMDFLLLLPRGVRIVVEVDGQHHYAEGNEASPRLYSKMVAEDRALRLKGYEVYRFGGYELGLNGAPAMLRQFFAALLGRQR